MAQNYLKNKKDTGTFNNVNFDNPYINHPSNKREGTLAFEDNLLLKERNDTNHLRNNMLGSEVGTL